MPGFPKAPTGIFMSDGNKPSPHGYGVNSEDPLADDVVANWPMQEGAGLKVQDVVSGNGSLDGTNSGVTWVASDRWPAISLNGSSDNVAIDSRILPDIQALTNLTVAAWVNFINDGNLKVIFSTLGGGTNGWRWAVNNTEQVLLRSGGATIQADTDLSAVSGTWQHLAFTSDADRNVVFYLNGQPDGTDTATAPGVSGLNPRIGTDGANFYTGQIGGLVMHRRALRASEVKEMFERPFRMIRPGTATPFVAEAAVGNPWYHYAQQHALTG